MRTPGDVILDVRNISLAFGGVKALADIATEMTFEDGRRGTLAARIAIHDMKTYPVPAKPMEKAA